MKRAAAGSVLIVLGVILVLLPYGLIMTSLCLWGYAGLLLVDAWTERFSWHRRIRMILISLGGAVFLFLSVGMIYVGSRAESQWEQAKTSSYAIVLGAQVQGNQPSRTLRQRLDVGLLYLQENPTGVLIVSGGQGPDEDDTEAAVMYAYLERHGADMQRVIQEPQASNTRENLMFSAVLAQKAGCNAAQPTIITSEYHLCRAQYIAGTLDMEPTGLGSKTTPWILMWNYELREVFALVKAWFVAST
ncbi:YdcF family protein [Candidatus Avoscillospira sp. LCP25S3_F1]|uniref:YdcF family protein n=1 Tax=Candidatus Avoscillospira sp. LCP25S3_F1 TaxID=3438825 RepID=UPI003F91E61C